MTPSVPTVVDTAVFPLAGAGFAPPEAAGAFEDPVPLGVRLYGLVNAGEWWVTRWVDDISFRSVVPGGFASATITLRMPRNPALPSPDQRGFSDLTELFRRIQIVDLRTMEIAWEGRIEDPARQVDPDTWQIGALGSMVAATDIQRPVFYVDSSVEGWISGETISSSGSIGTLPWDNWQTSKDASARNLTTTFSVGFQFVDGFDDYAWRWDSHGYDQPIARFTTTHDGGASTGGFTNASVVIAIAGTNVDSTLFSSGEVTKTNIIGTDFTDQNARYILIGDTGPSGSSYTVTSNDVVQIKVRNPKVIGMRRDRFGNKLVTAASYPSDYVTVAQVVEDVVGRFLVSGWYELSLNEPWPGSVRGQDVYIDSSNGTHILHLAYPDGATAADILGDLVNQVQTNAYWAIWESKWTAADADTDFGVNSGFRFEWATWPNNWGYLVSSQDGFEGQPNGDDVYNFTSFRYQNVDDANQWHVTTMWEGLDEMAPEMYLAGFTRAATVNKQDPTNDATSNSLASAYLDGHNKVVNAGTITVRRPIPLYDAGSNSASGAGRMVDPWMIRPGKLVRIVDLPPRAMERDVSSGVTLPAPSIDGTLFRVVATEYNSSDNSCRMELDQVTRWQVPTQISRTAPGGSKTIRIQ